MPVHSFAAAPLEDALAHGGKRTIRAARVAQRRTGSSINFIDQVIVPPGSDIGLHRHADTDEEIYVVIAGQALAYIDGSERLVSAGDVLVNPPGGVHGVVNDSAEPLVLVVIDVSTNQSAYIEPTNEADRHSIHSPISPASAARNGR